MAGLGERKNNLKKIPLDFSAAAASPLSCSVSFFLQSQQQEAPSSRAALQRCDWSERRGSVFRRGMEALHDPHQAV